MAKILIVDDHPVNRYFLTSLLGYDGHELFEAGNGLQALESMKEHHPDLIILDLYMPGMDGAAFLGSLESERTYSNIPVIIYTASDAECDIQGTAKRFGITEVILKPSAPKNILDRVAAVLIDKTENTTTDPSGDPV